MLDDRTLERRYVLIDLTVSLFCVLKTVNKIKEFV